MDNYKIKVKDEAESKEAQELFVQLGYELNSFFGKYEADTKWVLAFADGSMGCASEALAKDTLKEITLPQLRDLVVLKRNDVNDANYKSATDFYYVTVENQYYFWNGFAWCLSDADFIIGLSPIIDNPENKDPALISGADVPALIKKGESVQFRSTFNVQGGGEWKDLDLERDEEEFSLGDLINTRFEWRIKPQTIKLELELPKPFEPKEGEMYWFVSPFYSTGYDSAVFEDHQADKLQVQYGAYRTQVEIKQVVEQLRKIRGA
ncbi:hypothetical protein [Acinetobacter baumannii]|uniref:hypothetical protein n=1 Tax=Acinetobacter baumannii TaxID=470 RepID=UPI001FD68DBB|nr:hypothetical protein [Acinetobacter baumannii]